MCHATVSILLALRPQRAYSRTLSLLCSLHISVECLVRFLFSPHRFGVALVVVVVGVFCPQNA